MMDTCAGEVDPALYREVVVPAILEVLTRFKKICPEFPILYYSKGTSSDHWSALKELPIAGIGIDWNHNLAQVLREWGDRWVVQGNIDPHWLFLPSDELEQRVRKVFEEVKALPASLRRGWIAGLGHGVLPKTPEENVRLVIRLQKEIFGEGQKQ
jgi:uroporphyrinogen decarboxylase